MIVVDSDVASAMMLTNRDARIVAWLNDRPAADLWLNAITAFEIKGGIEALPDGRRKRRLVEAFNELVHTDLGGRVLAFDMAAAMAAVNINIDRKRRGRPAGTADTQIAGIAVSRNAAIATRNVRHFDDLSIEVINPWDAADHP